MTLPICSFVCTNVAHMFLVSCISNPHVIIQRRFLSSEGTEYIYILNPSCHLHIEIKLPTESNWLTAQVLQKNTTGWLHKICDSMNDRIKIQMTSSIWETILNMQQNPGLRGGGKTIMSHTQI